MACLLCLTVMMCFPFRCLAFLLLLTGIGHAEMINYQGRLTIHGVPLEGEGRFRFAVVGRQGDVLWASSEMKVHVSKGEYSVRLGDSAQAPPISGELLRQGAPAKLRIWFAREGKAWTKAGADAPLDASLVEPRQQTTAPPGMNTEVGAGTAAGASPFVTVSISGAPALGVEKAPLVLVEYTDFRSPAAVRFQTEVFPRLKSAYVDTGKLRIVTRVLPSAEPVEDSVARAAWCANAQGKFWEMREKLFASGGALSLETSQQIASAVALDAANFTACFADAQAANAILKDQAEAKGAGIIAAPTFILGQAAAGRVAGVKFTGEPTFENLAAEIEKSLMPGGTR
jgi:protein-disulfide isomerase